MRPIDVNTLQVQLQAVGIKLSLWETQRVVDQIQTASAGIELDLLVEDMVRADQRLVQVLEKITMDADVLNRIAPREESEETTVKPQNPVQVIRCRDWFSNPPTYTYSEIS